MGEEEFAEAGEAFRKGAEAERQADALAASAAAPAPVPAPMLPPPVAPLSSKGAKVKRTPVLEAVDLERLPLTYHQADEAKIRRHILDGTITASTPGIKFHIEESFGGTGR